MIHNHIAPSLSELDLATARAVPPGGNWKNVPLDIPLKRLQTIRDGFAAGLGSRSTYYGRLRRERPAYTINTFFTRPGNGCHLHYDYEGGQHRTLSFREAARLQSFPDDFSFCGPKTSIAKQIGNAVPPLLGYRIAKSLGPTGQYIDLFAGAGGLSLGFKWAGWLPIVANEIEAHFAATYRENVHEQVVVGDIRSPEVFEEVISAARAATAKSSLPLWVLGGPPCQGFSTAGKRRSMDDERNHLFLQYKAILAELNPVGFVFENVSGLLNMDRGTVFKIIRESLSEESPFVDLWLLHAERHAIPQRRTRVVLIGHDRVADAPAAPEAITSLDQTQGLFVGLPQAVSAEDALDDLPRLVPSEDGSGFDYRSEPTTPYQCLMRGVIDPTTYLRSFTQSV